MDTVTAVGSLASLCLVLGAALPDRQGAHPARLLKNQIFTIGNIGMACYAITRFTMGGSLFFVFLEAMMLTSTVLMMFNAPEKMSGYIVLALGAGLSIAAAVISLIPATFLIIGGLTIAGIAFTMPAATVRRNILFVVGSLMVAAFSVVEQDPVFLWMNVFFAVFSFYHAIKLRYSHFRR